MQTFLPYPDFAACAAVLDTRRLADSCEVKIRDDVAAAGVTGIRSQAELAAAAGALPPWLGDDDFHRRHTGAPCWPRIERGTGRASSTCRPASPNIWPGRA